MAAIDRDYSTGSIEPTGRATDMALDGAGFFVVQGTEQRYTRDGSFSLNAANELVTTSGDFVRGFAADEAGNTAQGSLSNLSIPLGTSTTAKATTQVTLQGNLNSSGPAATGASILTSQLLTTVGGAAPLELGAGAVRGGSLEQSNVDLSQEFVNLIISSTGFSAASRVISTSDQLITELLNTSR